MAIGTGNISTIFQTINGNVYAAGMYKVDETRICDVTQDYWLTGIEPDPMGINTVPVHVLMAQKVQLIAAGGNFNAALLAYGTTLVTTVVLLSFCQRASCCLFLLTGAGLITSFVIVYKGLGLCGQMARSAQMTSPNEGGDYSLSKLLKNEDGEYRRKAIVEIFLTTAPVI